MQLRLACKERTYLISEKTLSSTTPWILGCFCAERHCSSGWNPPKKNGDCSLSDGMRRLCQERKLKAFDVGDGRWQDVDTPEAFAYTESIFEHDFCESPILKRLVHA